MAIQLDDLVARLRLDTSGLASGVRSVEGTLGRVGDTSGRVGRRMSLGMTAPLVGIAVAGVNLAASFDKTMRQVAIATDGPSKALSDLAIKMGAETAFSAGEAADAMLELAKGGMTAAQIQGGVLAETMKLATVGEVDLATASTYVSTAMNQYGLKAKDAQSITVALAGAANAGSASVDSLAQGLGNVGGVAKNMGLSIQETTGILSLLDNAGIKGAEGGTALRSMLNGLTPTSVKAKNAMQEFGLSFQDAQGNFRPMADVAEQLRQKLGGLSEAQRAQTLETIFGTYGQQAATQLMNGGREAVEKYTKASYDAKTTQELANAAMEGTSGALERAKGSIETAALMIGNVLAPYVEKGAALVELLANKFSSLPSSMQGLIVAGGAILAVVGPLLIGFGFLLTAIAAIGLPVIGVVAALAALGAALAAAYSQSSAFRAAVASAFTQVKAVISSTIIPGALAIRDAFMRMYAAVRPIIMQIVGVVRSNMPQIKQTITSVFNSVKSIISSVLSIVVSVINIATKTITATWSRVGDTVLKVISIVFPAVLQIIRGAFTVIEGLFSAVAALLKGDWSGLWDSIKQILTGAFEILKGIVKVGWGLLVGIFREGIQTAMNLIRGIPGKITGALSGAGDLLVGIGQAIMDGLKAGLVAGFEKVKDFVGGMAGTIKGLKGPESYDRTLLIDNGKWIMASLDTGLRAGAEKTKIVLRGITRELFDGIAIQTGPVETDVLADIAALFERIEQTYGKQAEKASARLTAKFEGLNEQTAAHFDKLQKKLEKALDRAEKTKGKADDKAAKKALNQLDAKEQAALDKLEEREAAAQKRVEKRYRNMAKAARAAVATITAALTVNARAQDEVNAKLDVAREKLSQLQEQAASFAAGIRDSFVDYSNVVGLGVREVGDKTTVTITDVLADLRERVAKGARFAQAIALLTARGLNQTTIQQLLSAGIEGGLATAEAIAEGGVGAVEEINSLTGQLTTLGTNLGTNLATTFYGSGIQAAQAVVDGLVIDLATLEAQAAKLRTDLETVLGANTKAAGKKAGADAIAGVVEGIDADGDGALDRSMRRCARRMIRSLRDELDMHSPSRKLKALGKLAGGSVALGLDASLGGIEKAAARIASATTFAPASVSAAQLGVSSLAGSQSLRSALSVTTAAPNVRVFVGERELTDIVRVEVGTTLQPLTRMSRQGAI